MRKMLYSVAAAGLLLASAAWAQTAGDAYDDLSPGNQMIARALFNAQTSSSSTTPLTLKQIAAMKQSGQGWGEVFRTMRAKGFTDATNLGSVVSAYRHSEPGGIGVTTGLGRSESAGIGEAGEAGSHGVDHDTGFTSALGGGHGGTGSAGVVSAGGDGGAAGGQGQGHR
ncbi:MAG: hypothetical protein KGL11_05730 [Alphaproteobacteria bacterium]|nr:hypothetical protein [Alphaproteobacteria bacterium]